MLQTRVLAPLLTAACWVALGWGGLKAHYTQLLPAWHLPPSADALSPIEEGRAAGEAATLLLQQPPLPTPQSGFANLLYFFLTENIWTE